MHLIKVTRFILILMCLGGDVLKNLAAMIVLMGFTTYPGYQYLYYHCSFNAKVSPFLSHVPSSIQSEKEELKGSKMEIRIRIH